MVTYRDFLEYQNRAAIEADMRYATIRSSKHKTKDDMNMNINSTPKENDILSVSKKSNEEKSLTIPGMIRDLLKSLVERKVIIILDAEDDRECVEIEAVVGDLLVAQTQDCEFKFIDIDCICAVIVDGEELLESIIDACKCQVRE